MKKIAAIVAAVLVLTLAGLGYYLFRPLATEPTPADFHCYDLGQGAYVPLEVPRQAFGMGLAYAGHIQETASEFDPDAVPPVSKKSPRGAVRTGAQVRFPTSDELIQTADAFGEAR